MVKKTLFSLLFCLLLGVGALAQDTVSTGSVEYTDGQRIEWTDDGKVPASDLLMNFLQSGKDGKLTIMEGGKLSFAIEKVGDQLTLTSPTEPTEKMTVQELIDQLSEPQTPENPEPEDSESGHQDSENP
jgi:hypothetical protein